jgi:NAD(P)-dependent dehydrogenase (short-subunit alcohol dehydrogenase family)
VDPSFINSTQGLTGRGAPEELTVTSQPSTGTVGLRRAWANWRRIRVNTVRPTWVETLMIMNDAIQDYMNQSPDIAGVLTNLLPVVVIQSECVTNAVAWISSDEARHVTGVALPIDAGFCAK